MTTHASGPASDVPQFRQTVFTRPPQSPKKRRKWGSVLLVGGLILLPFALGVGVTLSLTRAMPQAAAPQPPSLEDLVQLSLSQEPVTRGAPVDLLAPSNPMAEVINGLQTDAVPVPATPAVEGPVNPIGGIVDQEVADLQAEARAAERAIGLHMRMLREGVLAGVYTVETREANGTRQIKLRPINVELSQRFMKNLLLAAEARGEIRFPRGLSTEDGSVDLDTMLFNLVQNSLANDGTLEGAEAAREMTMRAFQAAGVQQPAVDTVKTDQTYTVEPGDSLAYISLKFYGVPGDYRRIFEANRGILQSPERIRVGQRLVIPG